MSFREKSAWVMAAVMAFAGLYYFKLGREVGWDAPPFGVFVPFVGLVIVASVVAQTTLAIWTPKEASAPADERERPLLDRAGNWAGWVLAAALVGAMWHFLYHRDANLFFHLAMGSLILSQASEYVFQLVLFRRNG